MTDAERDELIEKSLLKELDAASEARVQQLRNNDNDFRQEYDFQETLIQQVRLKRRQELLSMFAEFETEQATNTDEADTTPVIPLSTRSGQNETTSDLAIIPLWRQSWFRVAATVALAVLLGAVIWWQLSKYDPQPIAGDDHDSTKIQMPKDTQRNKSVESPRLPTPGPQGPVAQGPRQLTPLQGPTRLPYYETDDISLGFGKDHQTNTYRTVVFSVGSEPAYEFQDTLKVYLPKLPATNPAWSLVYSHGSDTYYLITGKTQYEIIKGLQGKRPLTKVK